MKNFDLGKRLKLARERAGFKSASEAARRIGVNVVTYTAHENGTREFDREASLTYAKNFSIDPAWLMFGEEAKLRQSDSTGGVVLPDHTGPTSNGEGDGVGALTTSIENRTEFWVMTEEFLEQRLKIRPVNAQLLEIKGDFMYDPRDPYAPGSLLPGDRAIVDLTDTTPSPAGAFAVHDGQGVTIKMLEVIPNSEPMIVRITGRNPGYATYEREATEIEILGRVKAKLAMV